MIFRILLITAIGIVLFCERAEAGVSMPVSLHSVPGGQGEGLGGAYTAVAEGVYGQRWNPAGTAMVKHLTGGFSYLYTQNANDNLNFQLGADPVFNRVTGRHFFGGLVLPPGPRTAWIGVGLYYSRYVLPGIEIRDPTGRQTGRFDASDQTMMVSLAYPEVFYHPIVGRLSAGVNLSFLRQNLLIPPHPTGFSTGFGLIHEVTDRFRYGFALRNAYSRIKRPDDNVNRVEREVVLGGAYKWEGRQKNFLFTADLVQTGGRIWSALFGGEYFRSVGHEKWIAIRGGGGFSPSHSREDVNAAVVFRGFRQSSGSLGLGYSARFQGNLFFTVDYSVDLDQDINSIGHRHNVNMEFELRRRNSPLPRPFP